MEISIKISPLYTLTNLMRLQLSTRALLQQAVLPRWSEYLEMLRLKQPVTAAQTEPGADSCGLQMSKQVLPSKNKNKLITFATSGLISGR